MYTEKAIDHFITPRNIGRMDHPDGFARVKSDIHEDQIELYIRVEEGRVAEIKYLTFGCVAAIASSSITSELATGLPLDEAVRLTAQQVSEALGGLPEGKLECSVLAPEALRQAIADYRERSEAQAGT
ncbi:MAG: iron-sulfur cluster assembly scaffold protein [Chloroflexi bacterium]|nr:iron-sulfur cluster assembly scaffold protein [Chloroflexota bacterium]